MPKGPENTPKFKSHLNAFYGGGSIDFKYGIPNSFYYAQSLDFRSKASQMSVLPGPTELARNMSDLITDMDQSLNGTRVAVGSAGNVYTVGASSVTQVATLDSNGAAGIKYSQNTDNFYIPSQQTVSIYGPMTNANVSARFISANFAQSASISPGVTQLYDADNNSYDGALRTSATASYTVGTTIVESATTKCPFSPDIEPFYSIKVWITAAGTGNWTLTLHDALNNVLEAVTIANANIVANAYNEFVFTTAGGIRAVINQLGVGSGALYHFHLTSTVADGTVQVVTASDLSGANMELYAYRLVKPNNGWHPCEIFAQYLCIGNGKYLSTYDFTADSNPNNVQWNRHQIIFRQGYEVCGLSTNDQWLVIALERRSTDATKKYQDGQLAFWDGGSQGINFFIDIPMGAPYGVHTFNNITYFYVAGSLYAWAGGKTVMKVRVMAYQNTDYLGVADNTIVNPHMIDNRYNLLMLGYPSSTTNVNINYGVWSWGAIEMVYPNSFGLSYTLSNGTLNYSASNNLQIGMVRNFVDTMYTSWQSTSGGVTTYGLDILNNSSTPASTFDWQSLIYDGGVVYKQKNALRYYVRFLPMPTGCQLRLKYKIDRAANWTYGSYTSVGDTVALLDIPNGRFHELQWGFEGTCDTIATSPPTITGITMEIEPGETEDALVKDT